ncbi:glycosyltransferase family 4 protein [Bacillus megaterium]|nr:glycosyltransferase family 4 protein [Priestia megaterium]
MTITGFVEDLEIEIANSKAMIVPLLFGTGVKLKTLDAFRCSTPVIGTNYAFEGIAIDDRIRKYRYDTEYELIDKIKEDE